jgi:hypothetical protein
VHIDSGPKPATTGDRHACHRRHPGWFGGMVAVRFNRSPCLDGNPRPAGGRSKPASAPLHCADVTGTQLRPGI